MIGQASHERVDSHPGEPSPQGPRRAFQRATDAIQPPVAVLAATAGSATALTAVIEGAAWFGYVPLAALLVTVTGAVLRRWRVPAVLVAAGQLAALLLLVTGVFTQHGIAVVFPGPDAFHQLDTLLSTAGEQAYLELPPVAATEAVRCLVTVAAGVIALLVDTLVTYRVPAVAGLPLLGVYAVPAALSDELLPWWSFVLGTAGYAVLLTTHHRRHQRTLPAGSRAAAAMRPGNPATPVTVLVVTVVAGLLAGAVFTGIGTTGDVPGSTSDGARPVAGGGYGVHPFTSLRGLLNRAENVPMFEVSGLGSEQRLLRAFTLSQYKPNKGWTRPDGPMPRGVPASGGLPEPDGTERGGRQRPIRIEPLNWNDVWLPIYGVPSDIRGLGSGWIYHANSGTVFRERSKSPHSYTEIADINRPSKQQLREADKNTSTDGAASSVSSDYTELPRVDDRVARLAKRVTSDATTRYDKARAVWEYFDPGNGFSYDLETAPATDQNALADFLFHGKRGYCEQYASSMAVMLRSLDVPTRVAVGFTTGERDGARRTITTRDAHAWVQVYFPDVGWVNFDPTPLDDGRGFTPEYLRDQSRTTDGSTSDGADSTDSRHDREQHEQSHLATPEGSDTDATTPGGESPHSAAWGAWVCVALLVLAGALTVVTVRLRRRIDRQATAATKRPPPASTLLAAWLPGIAAASWTLALLLAGRQVHWLLGVVLAVFGLGAATPTVVRETRLRRRLHTMATETSASQAAWRELRDQCHDRGLLIGPSDTLRSAAERITETGCLDAAGTTALHTLVGELEHAWYGPVATTSATQPVNAPLVAGFTTFRHHWKKAAPLSLRAKLFPRSVRSGNADRVGRAAR